ncbi:MAG TPA: biotin carboxylase N-terminal domain-containing protein [Ktedonobacterales bacterium]|nr:biotin carboxylase N-terminal domain-containing protein [Ktedonobacterales bacterium]
MGAEAMSRAARHTAPAAPETQAAATQPPAAGGRLIRKVLVANRGEIACRVMRTCRAMGIATVAVFSDADARARHVREADEAVRIGPPAPAASYLNIPVLIAAAQRTGADAVHPGYGFLAEQADFAHACRDAGLTFIGPSAEVIARMGSKREAKREMAEAGVPVIPGYDGADQTDAAFLVAAETLGFPLLVKASAGGGGKGMRAVSAREELPAALAAARREAAAAFGDDTLLLEKLLGEPRHVELQIFGDTHGAMLHLGERECSIQRRHQKVVEETPSPALTPELRARMGAAAVTVGRRLGYTGAGTVEFLLDRDGSFYFLEVNTRLQVEHPVTELVTGLDLVRWQILVAEGRPLPLAQEAVAFGGHAIEARVYAEDPASGFLPATGQIALWRAPEAAAGVRVDAGITSGDLVSPYYDPLLVKISAHGATRAEALRRLERALATTTLLGVRTNLDFLRRTVLHPDHLAGDFSTAFIERHAADLLAPPRGVHLTESPAIAALAVALLHLPDTSNGAPAGWRNNPHRPAIERFKCEHERDETSEIVVRLAARGRNRYAATLVVDHNESAAEVLVHERSDPDVAFELDGHLVRAAAVEASRDVWWVKLGDATHALRHLAALPTPRLPATLDMHARGEGRTHLPAAAGQSERGGAILAPMPGQVVAVLVAEGQPVRAGDPLVILEAMKMEHTLRAPRDGCVVGVRIAPGEQVDASAILLDLRPSDASEM